MAECGADHVSPIVLHLRTGAREWFMQWLEENHSDLVPKYVRLYPKSAYAPKAYQEEITGRVHELAERFGVGRSAPREARRVRERVAHSMSQMKAGSEQLSLL